MSIHPVVTVKNAHSVANYVLKIVLDAEVWSYELTSFFQTGALHLEVDYAQKIKVSSE